MYMSFFFLDLDSAIHFLEQKWRTLTVQGKRFGVLCWIWKLTVICWFFQSSLWAGSTMFCWLDKGINQAPGGFCQRIDFYLQYQKHMCMHLMNSTSELILTSDPWQMQLWDIWHLRISVGDVTSHVSWLHKFYLYRTEFIWRLCLGYIWLAGFLCGVSCNLNFFGLNLLKLIKWNKIILLENVSIFWAKPQSKIPSIILPSSF